MAISYSNSIGDSDNDGYPEIAVNNINHDNIFLWKNTTVATNNWLKVKLEGTQSNKNGIGSLIELSLNGEKQYRYTLCGEGYLSQNSATEIFGLGTRTIVDYIKVKWLSGVEDILYNVNVNQLLNITEGSTLSIAEEVLNSVKVYPNPVRDILNIKSVNPIKSIVVYNMIGQSVFEVKTNQLETNINISSLYSGVYFVSAQTDDAIETIEIIKQ